MGDRTDYVPTHTGRQVLPNLPFFHKLLRYAQRKPARIAIRDVNAGLEKSYQDLMSDALVLREELKRNLKPETLQQLSEDKEIYIGLLAPGGYEYTVGFIAILALGAAVVPLASAIPVEEASYFLHKAQCVALLVGEINASLGQSTIRSLGETRNFHIPCLAPIASFFASHATPADEIVVSSNRMLDMNGASAVIFTSGTTGPPKGAVQRRTWLTGNAEADADFYHITEQDVVLHVLPVHHASGVGLTFPPFIIAGACIEFRSGSFDTAWTWERWRRGGLSFFSAVPTIYMRMMRYYEEVISQKSSRECDEFISGARNIRTMLCGSSALPGPVQDFWETLRQSPILTRYGATEFGAVIKTDLDPSHTPRNSVGRVVESVSLRLEADGHLLVKCPYMFSKYLHDEKATIEAHTKDGYFRSGDIARREGPYYFILGRASVDIIKSGGYKISALDVEREILGLDYVAEVMVVGVEDEEFGQRVAATISLKKGSHGIGRSITLERLRQDLRDKLTSYRMPTILRVVEDELPKSGTAKVQKKVLGPIYFPPHYRNLPDVQVWESGGWKAKI